MSNQAHRSVVSLMGGMRETRTWIEEGSFIQCGVPQGVRANGTLEQMKDGITFSYEAKATTTRARRERESEPLSKDKPHLTLLNMSEFL